MQINEVPSQLKGSRWLVILILISTFSQNYFDLVNILEGGQLALFAYDGPIFLKIGKDICYFLVMVSVLINFKKFKAGSSFGIASLIFGLVIFMVMISIYFNGLVVALIGFRWTLPFLIFLVIGDWSQKIDKDFFVALIFISLIGCFAFQLVQLFIMPPVFGEIFFGLAARTPGYFVAPNSAAFYGCSCAALVFVAKGRVGKMTITSLVVALLVSALAQSGTGLIVASLLIFWYFIYPNLSVFVVVALLLGLVILFNLNLLTGREDYVEISGGGRIEVLHGILYESMGSMASFGKYTNAANLTSGNPEGQLAVDSLVAAWIGNFGLLWPLATILVACFIIKNIHQFDKKVFGPVLVFVLFSMTTIVFEAFPMNIILVLSIWWSRVVKFTC